jgi:hypothetical protein
MLELAFLDVLRALRKSVFIYGKILFGAENLLEARISIHQVFKLVLYGSFATVTAARLSRLAHRPRLS